MDDSCKRFQAEREGLNELVFRHGTQTTKRFFNLDGAAYRDGALTRKQKELLGLVASAVLRCDDCITYHMITCAEQGFTRDEVVEALDVALVVGGSITIPHVRRAYAKFAELGFAD
jgi:AhpD family alkylhydroperoxidase